jgi:hypothetical protein
VFLELAGALADANVAPPPVVDDVMLPLLSPFRPTEAPLGGSASLAAFDAL